MKTQAQGFSLIETLVAIGILSAMIFGAITLISQMVTSSTHNRNVVTAGYMLQECMELSRNLRDTLWKQNLVWHCDLDEGQQYYISNTTNERLVPHECIDPSKLRGNTVFIAPVNSDKDSDFKVHWKNVEPPFFRSVKYKPVTSLDGAINETAVECMVWWYEQGQKKELSISQLLTNWFKR